MIEYAWLVPFFPLLGALIAAAGGRWLKDQAHIPVVAGIALACVVSLSLLGSAGSPGTTKVYDWIEVSNLHVPVLFRVDGLTTMMLAMVTFVATLIAVFSIGYMAGDPGYPRFFCFIGLFVFSMTGLVLSSNYALTYAFWEGVGACSYLLVGFWYYKPAAAAAAKKAFLVNRVGDFGFATALFLMWAHMPGHSLNYEDVLNPAVLTTIPLSVKFWIAVLLFWGATAKSAQIPLYVWLPDAMEGPTPVSALIHAATMVTAGVYLVARSSWLLFDVPEVRVVIALVGGLTALLAAAIALTQTDLKRVLAYSTISQLGYMFMGLGAGIGRLALFAVVAGMFHLFTHAFFKALLFLGAGSVMHSMGGVIDMRRFRGLRHRMPWTFRTFAVGGLALAGIFPFAGFWSKDDVLAALKSASHEAGQMGHADWGAVYVLIYWLAVFTAFLTAFYTGRAFFLTFFGPEKLPSPGDPEAELEDQAQPAFSHSDSLEPHAPAAAMSGASALTPPEVATNEPVASHDSHGSHDAHGGHLGHESPPIMTVPLMVLAVCATLVGLVFGPTGWFAHHLALTPGFPELGPAEHHFDWLTAIVGTLVGVAGLALSWWMYGEPSPVPARLAERLRPLYEASYHKFGVDTFYNWVVVAPTRILAALLWYIDYYVVDNLIVRGAAWLPRTVGKNVLAPFQNGLVQFYAAVTAASVALLLLVLLFAW